MNRCLDTDIDLKYGVSSEVFLKLMFQALAIRSEEGLKLETSVLETLFGGKFTVSLSLSVCLSVCLV